MDLSELTLELVVFYLLLIDSVAANLMVWCGGEKWYAHKFRVVSRYFPATKGWVTYYLILVLWIGYLMKQSGTL